MPPTVKWVKGDNPFGRIAVVMLAAIAATLFAFLNIGSGVHGSDGLYRCLLLLVVGVFFACLWIIPGRPRQWGLNWFEALMGLCCSPSWRCWSSGPRSRWSRLSSA